MPATGSTDSGSGGPDGVRTRDRPVKSRMLYLTELQAQRSNLGFHADLPSVHITYGQLSVNEFVKNLHFLPDLDLFWLEIIQSRQLINAELKTYI